MKNITRKEMLGIQGIDGKIPCSFCGDLLVIKDIKQAKQNEAKLYITVCKKETCFARWEHKNL